MSIQGCAYVESEMKNLLRFMDLIADLKPQEQLDAIRKEIESTSASAKSGWL